MLGEPMPSFRLRVDYLFKKPYFYINLMCYRCSYLSFVSQPSCLEYYFFKIHFALAL